MIKGTMMNRAEAQAVFGFVRPTLVLNGNDVSSVEKIQLDITRSTAMTITGEDVLSKTRVPDLSLDLLHHGSSWSCGNVLNVRAISVGNLRNSHDGLWMLRTAV